MSEQTASGAATETSSGASGSTEAESSSSKTVGWNDHKRVLDDMHKHKSEARDLRKQLEELEAQKLREANDWKTLYEREKTNRTDLETKYTKFKENYFLNHKYNAVQAEALKAGLRTEAESDLGLLSLDGVAVETTSEGRVLVNGAKEYIESLKKAKPHWFKSGEAPVVNTGGASNAGIGQPLTAEFMVQLEKKDPKKYKELLPKYLEQRKKAG